MSFFNKSSLRGVIVVYLSLVFALIFGLISSSVTAHLMNTNDLGQYRYLLSCISVTVSASTLGLFSSAGTLLAGPGSRTFKALVTEGANAQGWIVALAAAICVTSVFTIQSLSGRLDQWILACVLSIAMAWPVLMQEVFRARAGFTGIALLNVMPSLLFIIEILALRYYDVRLNTALCSSAYFFSQGIVIAVLARVYNFTFSPSIRGFRYLFKINKSLGLSIYYSTFFAAITAQAGIVILQSIRSAEEVGFFSLAITLTVPLTLLPGTIGTVYFSRLVNAAGFPPLVLILAWATSALVFIVFIFGCPFFVDFLYGAKFDRVVMPAQISAAAALLQGMGDVYNRYYLANKDTAFLLRIAVYVCVISLVASFVGTIYANMVGTAIARLIGSGAYLGLMFFYYHVGRRRVADGTETRMPSGRCG